MKSKRLLTCLLAFALTLTMTALPASAATFPDIASHWAKSYIEEMTDAGMFKGYEDGTFKPENKLTTAEALALCARAVPVKQGIADRIASDRKKDVDGLLNGAQSWFYREFAICLETGILSYPELKGLVQNGSLSKPIEKEDLSVYLVRAMQLGPMAEGLDSYSMTFRDTASIRESAKPYVYLLNVYGIVQGDTNNAYGPKGEVTRAIMATMLSRALTFMEERGTITDLSEYDDYDFIQGTIAAVTKGDSGVVVLTLTGDLTGATSSISLPADAVIYENNMETTSSSLKAGKHVRIALTSKGVAEDVYLSAALKEFTGSVNGIEDNSIALTVGGAGRVVTMNRFTQVQVGSKTIGDRSVVDPDAGYATAVCMTDDQGRLVAVRLTGGTREETGILSSVEKSGSGSTLRVSGFDGVTHQYAVPGGSAVTVNGLEGTLSSGYEGCYVSLRVSNEDGSALSVSVDSVTKYVQGGIKAFTWASSTNTVTLTDPATGKSTSYDVADSCVFTYNGSAIKLKELEKEWFATARFSGEKLVRLDCYPGSAVTEGVLTNRVFTSSGSTVTLEVTESDDTVVSFAIDLSDPPAIYRNEEKSAIDKLRLGDEVEVTVRYHVVTRIEATPQSANMTGTINRIIQEVGGSTLEVTLSDGEETSYTVTSATSITQSGKTIALSALKPGYKIGLVVNGDQVSAIEVQQAVTSGSQLNGTVVYVSTERGNQYIYLRSLDSAGNEELITVHVDDDTKFLEWDGGTLTLRKLEVGDYLQVNGAYDGAEFNAALILRQ